MLITTNAQLLLKKKNYPKIQHKDCMVTLQLYRNEDFHEDIPFGILIFTEGIH